MPKLPVETITYFWYFVADLLPRNSFTWTIALALETYVTFPIFFCTFTLFLLIGESKIGYNIYIQRDISIQKIK